MPSNSKSSGNKGKSKTIGEASSLTSVTRGSGSRLRGGAEEQSTVKKSKQRLGYKQYYA
jgi:hypothetical protein